MNIQEIKNKQAEDIARIEESMKQEAINVFNTLYTDKPVEAIDISDIKYKTPLVVYYYRDDTGTLFEFINTRYKQDLNHYQKIKEVEEKFGAVVPVASLHEVLALDSRAVSKPPHWAKPLPEFEDTLELGPTPAETEARIAFFAFVCLFGAVFLSSI